MELFPGKQFRRAVIEVIYIQLFKTFFWIGMFSFGGGYASMELIRSRVVEQQMWLTTNEFTDIISIAEMTPGP